MMNPLYIVNLAVLAFSTGIFCAARDGMLLTGQAATFVGVFVIVWLVYSFHKYRWKYLPVALLVIVFLLAGGVRFCFVEFHAQRELENYIGQELELRGKIAGEARVFRQADSERVYYVLAAERLRYGGCESPVDALVEVSCKREGSLLGRYGDMMTVYGKLRPVDFYKNSGQLDRQAQKARQGIYAKMSGRLVNIVPSDEWFLLRSLHTVRENIRQTMERAMPQSDAAALFAMLFGGYNGIRPEVLEAFSVTGIVHILSVSGSHITLLAGTMEKLSCLLRLPMAGRLLLIALTVLLYGGIAGFVPPVVRSVFMGLTVFVAEALGRSRDARLALGYIALFMLLYQPQLLFDISFLLSFLATAGLLYLSPHLTLYFSKLPRYLAVGLSVTAAAQLSTLPVLAWYFNAVSLSALAANLLLTPLLEGLLLLALFAVTLGCLFPFAAQLLLGVAGMGFSLTVEGVKLLACLPAASCYIPSVGIFGAGVYYVLLAVVFGIKCRYLPSHKKLALLLAAFLSFRIALLWPQTPELHFIDVGQGDAALFITAHHRAVLFDAGGLLDSDFDIGERVVVPYLLHYGVQRLDYVILTHAHADHAGGAGAVLRRLPVDHLLTADEGTNVYENIMKLRPGELANRLLPIQTGQTILIDGVKIEVVRGEHMKTAVTGNEISNVYRVTANGVSCLITGDLDAAGEAALLAGGQVQKTDILKVAHHGSKTSSSPDFIEAVNPAYAVISVGRNNTFGHPAAVVVQRLQDAGARVYRTDQDGAVIFKLGEQLYAVTNREERRRWNELF